MPRTFLLLLTLLILFSSCPPNQSDNPGISQFDLPTATSISAAPLTEGIHTASLTLNTGRTWGYRMRVPAAASSENVPLVIALHWAGGFNTYQEFGGCLAEPGLADLGAIVFSPEDFGQGWQPSVSLERLTALIDLAIEHWPVDPNRILIMGYSNGGIGTWLLAEELGDKVSAGIAMAGVYSEIDATYPLYVIHGDADELFPFAEAEEQLNMAVDAGTDVRFVIAESLGHYEACSYTSYLREAANWVQQEVW